MAARNDKHETDPVEKRYGLNKHAGDGFAYTTFGRRNRNRVSQRHFRERRDRHIKELEEQVKFLSRNERGEDAKLIRDYDALRNVLHKTRSQVKRLKTVVEELCTVMDDYSEPSVKRSAQARTNDGYKRAAPQHRCESCGANPMAINTFHFDNVMAIGSDAQDEGGDTFEGFFGQGTCIENTTLVAEETDGASSLHEALEEQECTVTYEGVPGPNGINYDIDTDFDLITNSVEIDPRRHRLDQLQLQSNANISSVLDPFRMTLKTFGSSLLVSFNTPDSFFLQRLYFLLDRDSEATQSTPWSLSEYIDQTIDLVRDYLKLVGGFNSYSKTSQACMVAMVVFVRRASPFPAAMWFASYCYSMVQKVMLWQVCRDENSTCSSISAYKPSELQIGTKHSSLIDWIHVPALRDRLIICYNGSQNLDKIFIDLLKHTVVEVADISKILTGAPQGFGFLGVCDLFNAMDVQSHGDIQVVYKDNTLELKNNGLAGLIQMHEIPPPDDTWICRVTCPDKGYWQPVPLGELLGSSQLAKQLYHYLDLYAAHKYWKIDPRFFEIYSELRYEGFETLCAWGVSHRLTSSWVGPPM